MLRNPISAYLTWKLPTRPRWTQMFARCWWCNERDEGERWKQQLYLWQEGKKLDGFLLFQVRLKVGIMTRGLFLIQGWSPTGDREDAGERPLYTDNHQIQACSRQLLRHLTGNPHNPAHSLHTTTFPSQEKVAIRIKLCRHHFGSWQSTQRYLKFPTILFWWIFSRGANYQHFLITPCEMSRLHPDLYPCDIWCN